MSLEGIRQNVIIQGRPFLTAARLARWSAHCVTHQPAIVAIGASGPRMKLQASARRFGSTSIYMKRLSYEPYLAIVRDVVRPQDQCWDVGANFGIYSLVMASRGATVTAFEPGAVALTFLRSNIGLNPDLDVRVVEKAVSSDVGAKSLFHIGGPATFSLGATQGASEESEAVETTTLDSLATYGNVNFVKIDVEGHEPSVLESGLNVLARDRPAILFENSASALARNGRTASDSLTILDDLGFAVYGLANGRLSRVHSGQLPDANFFAVHPDSAMRERFVQYFA